LIAVRIARTVGQFCPLRVEVCCPATATANARGVVRAADQTQIDDFSARTRAVETQAVFLVDGSMVVLHPLDVDNIATSISRPGRENAAVGELEIVDGRSNEKVPEEGRPAGAVEAGALEEIAATTSAPGKGPVLKPQNSTQHRRKRIGSIRNIERRNEDHTLRYGDTVAIVSLAETSVKKRSKISSHCTA